MVISNLNQILGIEEMREIKEKGMKHPKERKVNRGIRFDKGDALDSNRGNSFSVNDRGFRKSRDFNFFDELVVIVVR